MAKHVRVTTDLKAYQSLYDHEWAKQIDGAGRTPPLDEIILNLGFAWKSTAHVYHLPWLLVQSLRNFTRGYVRSHYEPLVVDVASRLADELLGQITTLLNSNQRVAIRKATTKITRRAQAAREQAVAEWEGVDEEEYWADIQVPEFQISLHALQRSTYCSVYFAYEHFVVECFRAVGGDPQLRIQQDEFRKSFRKSFGDDVYNKCWGAQDVQIAGEVRNSLAHNGGKPADRLTRMNHKLEIVNDEIQVLSEHNIGLFNSLKGRVLTLVEATEAKLTPAAT